MDRLSHNMDVAVPEFINYRSISFMRASYQAKCSPTFIVVSQVRLDSQVIMYFSFNYAAIQRSLLRTAILLLGSE